MPFYRSWKNIPFRKRLVFAFALILFLSLTLFAIFTIYKFTANANRQTLTSIQDNLQNMSAAVSQKVSDIDFVLSSVHADKNVQSALQLNTNEQNDYDTMSAMLQDSLLNSTIFRTRTKSVQLFSLKDYGYPTYSGKSLYNNIIYNSSTVSSERWYTQTLAADGKTCWFYNTQDLLVGKNTIFATRCVKRISNPAEQNGIIRAVISTSSFTSLLKASAFENSVVTLYMDGQYLTADGRDITQDDELFGICDSLSHRSGGTLTFKNYIAASQPVAGPGWQIILAVPLQTTRKNVLSFFYATFLVWIIVVAFSLVFCNLLSSFFSTPVNNLCRHMDEFSTRLELDVPRDSDEEISRLYNSFNAMVKKIDALIENEKRIEGQRRLAEIKTLQAQINPHFIYNTLESIKALAVKCHADDVVSITTSFGVFLRGSLNNGKHFTTLQKEIQHVCAYVDIQKIRYQNTFSFQTDIDASIEQYLVPNLILQPLVENCLTHAFFDIDYPGVILLEGNLEDGRIVLRVHDNGCGADTAELYEMLAPDWRGSSGDDRYYCLRNIRIRLENFFQHASIDFETNEDGGLTVILRFEPVATYTESIEEG